MIYGTVVTDASVVVEFLVGGLQWPDAALRLMRATAAGDVELVAPDLLFLEVASALRKLTRTGQIEVRAASRAVEVLGKLPIRSMATQDLLPEIWSWRDTLTTYDAAYAALARRTGLPVVTADAGLATALRRRSIRAVTLAELDADQPAG